MQLSLMSPEDPHQLIDVSCIIVILLIAVTTRESLGMVAICYQVMDWNLYPDRLKDSTRDGLALNGCSGDQPGNGFPGTVMGGGAGVSGG
jgi:hypothetical protein